MQTPFELDYLSHHLSPTCTKNDGFLFNPSHPILPASDMLLDLVAARKAAVQNLEHVIPGRTSY
jgi:hypothetical protein